MDIILCKCGHECKTTHKFCMNCGAYLGQGEPAPLPTPGPGLNHASGMQPGKSEPINIYPEDKGLKVLIDCCNKVGPLPTGERYSEIVLYYDEEKNSYQVHTYEASGYGTEVHKGYRTTKEHAEKVLGSLNRDAILQGAVQVPMFGGSRVIKFRDDQDALVRVEYDKGEATEAVTAVWQQLREATTEENRIVPEYAANWKQCVVSSSGMSMDNCYHYCLERKGQGSVSVKGSCFINGARKELFEYLELTDEECDELEKIPLGLLLSDVVVSPSPFQMNGFLGMVYDADSHSCTITYGDGRTDTKTWDANMLGDLNRLMKKIFARMS